MAGVTLRDIARKANVSVNTVSRALNDKPEVSQQTKERILTIARELGYTRNLVARGLATQQSHVIGVVVSDNVNPYFAEVIRGISFVAQAKQWTIFLVNTYLSRSTERAAIETLAQYRVGGSSSFLSTGTRSRSIAVTACPWSWREPGYPRTNGPLHLTWSRPTTETARARPLST